MGPQQTLPHIRHKLAMNVDLFKVEDQAGGPVALRNALREAMRFKGRDRSCQVWGETVGMFEIQRVGHIFEGEIGRIRMTDTPSIGSHDCVLQEIELQDDQGIAERTAFLYDGDRGVLAIHYRREAVSASRLAGYCDSFAQNINERFSVVPILRADTDARLRSVNAIKKVSVQYARDARGNIVNPDQSTLDFTRAAAELGAGTLDVIVSSGRKKADTLTFESAANFVQTALRSRGDTVEKLIVTGRNAADEKLVLDLLESRLRHTSTIEFRGRLASYEQRRRVVREAYDLLLPLFV